MSGPGLTVPRVRYQKLDRRGVQAGQIDREEISGRGQAKPVRQVLQQTTVSEAVRARRILALILDKLAQNLVARLVGFWRLAASELRISFGQ